MVETWNPLLPENSLPNSGIPADQVSATGLGVIDTWTGRQGSWALHYVVRRLNVLEIWTLPPPFASRLNRCEPRAHIAVVSLALANGT
jgi:hypothetical protein